MKTGRYFLTFCASISVFASMAQVADSTERKDRVRANFKVILNFDARRTQVDGENAKFNGLRIGAQRGKDIIAIGFYGLATPFIEEGVVLPEIPDTTDARLDINYVGLTYERILYDSRWWQLSVPVQVGLGSVGLDYRDPDSLEVFHPYTREEVVPLETGLRGAFKPFFWLYLTAGGGYRYVFTRDPRAQDIYSDLTWNFGLSIKLGEIVRYAKRKIREKRDGKEGS